MAEEADDHRGSAFQAAELTAGESMQIGKDGLACDCVHPKASKIRNGSD